MSWQQHLDTQLMSSGYVNRGGIFGHDGSTFAISLDFNVTPEEVTDIFDQFDNTIILESNLSIIVGGVRYFTIASNERIKSGHKGIMGVTVGKSNLTIVVVIYDATNAPYINSIIASYIDYLIMSGC